MVSHWKSVNVNGSTMIRSSGPIKEVIDDGVRIKAFDASHPIVFTKSEVFQCNHVFMISNPRNTG
eukprot:scaffold195041_cov34-Attheya_sp.AAC.1